MDFIERLFGISPDNGSGATEVSIIVALFAALGLACLLRILRRRRTPS